MLPARRRAKSSVPAATVALLCRSIRMKPPSAAVLRVGGERHRLVEMQVAVSDLVQFQPLGGQVLLGVHVDLVLDLGDRRTHGARADLQQVRPPRQQGSSPIHSRCAANWSATSGGSTAAAMTSPRLHVDFIGQRQRDRPACGSRMRQIAIGGDDARDARTTPAGSTTTSSPGATVPATTVPAKPRKSWFGRHTHCTGMRRRRFAGITRDLDGFQVLEQRGPVVPGHRRRARDHVVAFASADSGIASTCSMPSCAASSR
jgi:hypothetical protein